MRLRDSKLLALRLQRADKYFPLLKRTIAAQLRSQILEAARKAKLGAGPIPAGAVSIWSRQIEDAIIGIIHKISEEGWVLARKELVAIRTAGKAADMDFIMTGNPANIRKWVKGTAEAAAKTTARRMTRLYNKALEDGWTPDELSTALVNSGIVQTEARATLLARTGTVWAMNEGAEQRYKREGVAVKEWVTTEDDLACPFCKAVDGVKVRIDDDFVPEGTDFTIGKGRRKKTLSSSMPFDISHPPLHPHCRCTIVPVI